MLRIRSEIFGQTSLFGLFLVLALMVAYTVPVYAETCTSIGSGSWDAPGSWQQPACNGIPNGLDDDVTILAGHTITLNTGGNRQVRNLTIDPGGTLDFTGGDLRVSSSITANGTFDADSSTTTSFNSSAAGNKTVSGSGSLQFGNLRVTSNQVLVTPNVIVNISGLFDVLTGLDADLSSTFIFNAAGAQTWQLDTGSFDIVQLGNVVVNAGSSVTVTGGTPQGYRISGNLTVNGSFDATAAAINFNQSTTKSIDGTGSLSFADLSVQQGNVNHTANTTVQILGNLDIVNWTSEDATSLLIFNGGGTQNIIWDGNPTFNFYQLGSLTVDNNTTLVLPNNAATRINGNMIVNAGSTLDANGSLVSFNDFSAGNKTISGTGTFDFDDLSFSSNTINLASGTQIDIAGNVLFNASFEAADDSLVIFDGTTQQLTGTAGAAQFGQVTVAPGATVTSSMTNPFDLQISDFALIEGTYNADANTTVVFNGGASQDWTVNGSANLTDVEVTAGTTVDETVAADNTSVSGTILNDGTINKATKTIIAGGLNVGLASGNLPAGTSFFDTVGFTGGTTLQVSWIGQDNPNAGVPQQTGSYWTITVNETGSYNVNLNLPHNNLTNPSVCQYSGAGTVWNCTVDSSTTASVTYTGIFNGLENPTNLWTVGADANADLAVTKSVALTGDAGSDGNIDPGDTLTYTLVLENLGPNDVTGVVVDDNLPVGVTFVSSIASTGTYDSGTGIWNGIGLTSGASATLNIDVTVDAGTEGQTIVNTGTISASSLPDAVTGNNSDSIDFIVFDPPLVDPLEVTLVATDPNAAENPVDTGQFTVSLDGVNGTGSTITVNYTVNGTATAGADYMALSGSVDIPDGQQSATVDVIPLDDNLTEGNETVVVMLTGVNDPDVNVNGTPATVVIVDDESPNVIVSPSAQPNISGFDPALSKIGLLVPGETGVVGEQLEWVVTVSNTGGAAGSNVSITDDVDSRLQINDVAAPGAQIEINGQIVSVTYAAINPGESVQFSIFTTVLEGETVNNTVCISGTSTCATGSSVGQLPSTGESPWWRSWLLVVPVVIGGTWLLNASK